MLIKICLGTRSTIMHSCSTLAQLHPLLWRSYMYSTCVYAITFNRRRDSSSPWFW